MHVWCWWWRTPLRHVVRCRSLAFPSCVACCARGLARRLACVSENVLLRVVGLVGSTGMCVSRPVLGPLPFSSPRRVWLPRRGEEEVYIPVEMDRILFAVGAELPCTAGASCPWQMDDAHCSCNVRPPLPPPPSPSTLTHTHTPLTCTLNPRSWYTAPTEALTLSDWSPRAQKREVTCGDPQRSTQSRPGWGVECGPGELKFSPPLQGLQHRVVGWEEQWVLHWQCVQKTSGPAVSVGCRHSLTCTRP